mgnify:CR=1 FL=1
MTVDALLVFGARALADTWQTKAWATTKLLARLCALPPNAWVFSGGCEGSPDAWARELIVEQDAQIGVEEFRLDGRRWRKAPGEDVIRPVEPEETWMQYAPAGAEEDRGSRQWPLRRNDALARAMRAAKSRGVRVEFLGLLAPWSKTGGSRYMLRQLAEINGSYAECPGWMACG